MGYDLGSAVVGLIAGMGVTYAMVEVIKIFAGDNLGLDLTVTFTGRSLVVAFCLGVIATFLMVFASSWRASRLNITAAIRDLPESHPVNPEASTWKGYYRAALNGIVALALPIGLSLLLVGPVGMVLGLPLALAGLVSPWVFALRGSQHRGTGRSSDQRGPPKVALDPWRGHPGCGVGARPGAVLDSCRSGRVLPATAVRRRFRRGSASSPCLFGRSRW